MIQLLHFLVLKLLMLELFNFSGEDVAALTQLKSVIGKALVVALNFCMMFFLFTAV